ncbi:hypothetical protein Tco_1421859, partial [Tanacetum coccineum]
MIGFAPAMLNIPNNNNGWIEEDDEEEMEAEEDDEEEMEAEKDDEEEMKAEDDDEMDVEVNDDEDDAEVIYPYEEADPLNQPPPSSDDETKFATTAPITSSTVQPIPLICQFIGTFHTRESSYSRALLADNGRVSAPGPIGCNMRTLHSKVKTLDRQMCDRYNNEFRWVKKFDQSDKRINVFDYNLSALKATIREQGSDHSEMVWIVGGLSRQFEEFKEGNAYMEIKTPREELRVTQDRAEFYRTSWSICRICPVPRLDDPYAIVRDATTSAARDDGDDLVVPSDPQSSQPCRSPRDHQIMPPRRTQPLTQAAIDQLIKQRVDAAIATERERVRNERPAGGPAQVPAAAPPARECSFTGNKVMFAASTFQGWALTWWNSQVATLGLEV